jgi:hypothetical protein
MRQMERAVLIQIRAMGKGRQVQVGVVDFGLQQIF